MTIFICEDSFEAIMSCIYDAWDSKLGHQNIQIHMEENHTLMLFCEYRYVKPDMTKADKVIKTIKKKLSPKAYTMIYAASLSNNPQKADILYRFLLLALAHGNCVLDQLQNPHVFPIFELQRSVWNEAHFFKEFIRFSDIHGTILIAKIEPKNQVLTLIASHFADRLPSENWMIVDTTSQKAIVHPKDSDYYFTSLSNNEMKQLNEAMQMPDPYIDMWKDFFHTIGIKERKNYKCQRNMMPLWYRKNVTEFKS